MISGHITVQAQERILFGTPADTAVLAEVERYGARRVFVVSTRSLARLDDGPLHRVVAALGAKHAGTCVEVGAHSPRADVIAAAAQARVAGADLLEPSAAARWSMPPRRCSYACGSDLSRLETWTRILGPTRERRWRRPIRSA